MLKYLQALLVKNAKVYIAGRSIKKAEPAIADLLKQTGKKALWLELDLGSLKSVRRAARAYLE